MQHQIYAIKDKAANAYLQPIFSVNENTVIRSLKASLTDPNHNFRMHASDYSLYYLGLFDDSTGVLVPLQEPVFVVNCETILASMEVRNG